jgi:hypothetical protein
MSWRRNDLQADPKGEDNNEWDRMFKPRSCFPSVNDLNILLATELSYRLQRQILYECLFSLQAKYTRVQSPAVERNTVLVHATGVGRSTAVDTVPAGEIKSLLGLPCFIGSSGR